jgi:uncharacterized protein (TIGR03067 family)
MKRIVFRVAVLLPLLSTALLLNAASPLGAEEPAAAKWEYRAVTFGGDESENTKKLNTLAGEGWEYVGPLGNNMVAFRRRAGLSDVQALQGTWVWDRDGKQQRLVISGDHWSYLTEDGRVSAGTFTLVNLAATPKGMDMLVTEGNNKGGTVPTIYRLDGDTLHLCGNVDGTRRPTEFKEKPKDDKKEPEVFYIVARRSRS